MNLVPLSQMAADRAAAVADAEHIINTLIGNANAKTEDINGEAAAAGSQVSASGIYYGSDFGKVWRYSIEEGASIVAPRAAIYDDLNRMQFTIGGRGVVLTFQEGTNTITVETTKV